MAVGRLDSGVVRIPDTAAAVVGVLEDDTVRKNSVVRVPKAHKHQEGHKVGYWVDTRILQVDHTVGVLELHAGLELRSLGKVGVLVVHRVPAGLGEDSDPVQQEDKDLEVVQEVLVEALRRRAVEVAYDLQVVHCWHKVGTVLAGHIQVEVQLQFKMDLNSE